MEKQIFISHAGADKGRLAPYISHLLDRTEALPDIVSLWIDRPSEVTGLDSRHYSGPNARIKRMPAGLPWHSVINSQVQESGCVVVFYSDRAEPERSQVFANEIITALLNKKCVTLSLDPIRKRDKPEMLLSYIQWVDVSRFNTPEGDGGAFDGAIDQMIALLYARGNTDIEQQSPIQSDAARRSRFDAQALKRLADKQRTREMALLSEATADQPRIVDRRHIAEVFVERPRLSMALDRFVRSPASTFAVLGDAGMGKTSFLCNAANILGTEHPVLFFLGVELETGLKAALASDLRELFPEESLRAALEIVSNGLKPLEKKMFVVVDAINECPIHRNALRSELNELTKWTEGSAVRWLVSCRTLDWEFWIRNENNMIGRFGRSIFSDSEAGGAGSTTAREFEEGEFEAAWQKYKREYHLQGDLSPRLQTLCREPFMLRLVSELYKDGKEIPIDIDSVELFERFLLERFPGQTQLAANRCFVHIARKIISDGIPSVYIPDLSPEDFATCKQLMEAGVLVSRGDTHFYFRFELFLEFILSKYILSSIPETADSGIQLNALLEFAASPSVNIPGAIENILLSWQNRPVLASALAALASRDDRLKTTICSAIRKMKNFPPSISSAVEQLSSDSNFIIRRYFAQAIARHERTGGAQVVQRLMADRRFWEARETAANAIGAFKSQSDRNLFVELWALADDFHWRVRRAAGYAIHEMWRSNPHRDADTSRQHILENVDAVSWRQRHALCVGLIDSDASGVSAEAQVIVKLTSDANHQVRWMVANYLPRYVGAERPEVLDVLLKDADAWIRSRVASSLLALEADGKSTSRVRDGIVALARDPSEEVRIRIARELLKVGKHRWSEDILTGYLSGPSEVSFAAAYTLDGLGSKAGEELFGTHRLHDDEGRHWVLRERIARSEINPSTARFAPVQEYISQRFELRAENDKYMRVIDSMCSLIAAAAGALPQDSADRSRFLDLLAEDRDESVRWALVMFLSTFGLDQVAPIVRLGLLERLAVDRHFWVRREVALALGRLRDAGSKNTASNLLEHMRSAETESDEDCKDEVLYYINESRQLLQQPEV